jgi:acetoacetate decarboxylase
VNPPETSEPRLYRYRDAINGFFEFPTANARAILPRGLQPVEPHHGMSVLTVTAFEFHDSAVGAYREVALSIIVSPRIQHGDAMPRAAMFPFMVGTTTPEARQHGIEVWRLPHHPGDMEVAFQRREGQIDVAAAAGGGPILTMSITDGGDVAWETVDHRYQTFMRDDAGTYLSPLVMSGPFMEHEEERGQLTLHAHDFLRGIDPDEVTTIPFREQWMRDGVESIHPLQTLTAYAGR